MRRLTLDQLLEILTLTILLGFPLIWFGLTFYDVAYKAMHNDERLQKAIDASTR